MADILDELNQAMKGLRAAKRRARAAMDDLVERLRQHHWPHHETAQAAAHVIDVLRTELEAEWVESVANYHATAQGIRRDAERARAALRRPQCLNSPPVSEPMENDND